MLGWMRKIRAMNTTALPGTAWTSSQTPARHRGTRWHRGHARTQHVTTTKKLSKNALHARFARRSWAVSLNVNDRPVNHDRPNPSLYDAIEYWPVRGEGHDDAAERFCRALEKAAAKSLREPALLDILHVERCDALVIEWLAVLLETGPEMTWCDGSRVELNPHNLIVNLWLDESDPATPEVIERIINPA